MPVRWLDIAARGAYNLTSPGLADALVSVATHVEDWRFEWFAAESLALSPAARDVALLGARGLSFSERRRHREMAGCSSARFLASGAGQDVGGELGGNGWVRATLRLDNGGAGNLGLELRREDVASARWSGVRSVCVLPLGHGLRYSSEIEVVVPDHPDGRGAAWPWGLMALSWRSKTGWEVAGALEASSTPQHRYETDALVRLARSLDGAPTPSRRTPNAEAR